jgi:hypothetical protein
VSLGGVSQVAVAANTVVSGQFFLAISAPLVLAPLVEQRSKSSAIPAPFIWPGALVTTSAALVLINIGHLTLQFAFPAVVKGPPYSVHIMGASQGVMPPGHGVHYPWSLVLGCNTSLQWFLVDYDR